MKRDEALAHCKSTQLTEKRYVHTLGVVETAIELAEQFRCGCEKSGTCCNFS